MKMLFLIVFLGGGLLLVYAGGLPLAVWAAMAALVVLVRVMLPRIDPYRDELRIDDAGVTREHGSRFRRMSVESVRWDGLRAVEVRTREFGPRRNEMLFLLFGADGNGVAVPEAQARQQGLIETLAQRLPGWRPELLAEAEAAKEPATIRLWEAES
jgi:hypothetical protein